MTYNLFKFSLQHYSNITTQIITMGITFHIIIRQKMFSMDYSDVTLIYTDLGV